MDRKHATEKSASNCEENCEENSDTAEESDKEELEDEEEEEMDEASLMMEEAMEFDDLEVDIPTTAVNNKPSTSSTGFSLPLITLNEESQEKVRKRLTRMKIIKLKY